MAETNVVVASIGGFRKVQTRPVYQSDLGMILCVQGVTLPSSCQCDFAHGTSGDDAITVTMTNGDALIPDELIQAGGMIHAYVVVSAGEDDSETIYDITIPVIARAFVPMTPTPRQKSAVELAVEQCEAAVEHYPKVINGNWYLWDESQETWVDTGYAAQGDKGDKGDKGDTGSLTDEDLNQLQAYVDSCYGYTDTAKGYMEEAQTAQQNAYYYANEDAWGYANAAESHAATAESYASDAESAAYDAYNYAQDANDYQTQCSGAVNYLQSAECITMATDTGGEETESQDMTFADALNVVAQAAGLEGVTFYMRSVN